MTVKQKLLWIVIGGGLVLVLLCGSCAPVFLIASSMAGTQMAADLGTGPAVAVVRVEGMILEGDAPVNPFGDSTGAAYSGVIISHLKDAEADSEVKAIVLRVNSPGGSVVGSSEIYDQVLALTKPVIVSMGETAASGGYYVSAPADEIFANPATLTGSIGVISQFLDLSELFKEYGVTATTIKTGQFKDQGSMFRPMTEAEMTLWQGIVDECYQEFVRIVAEGRDLPEDEVKTLADGRVFTGKQALEKKLVDKMGNLPEAIDRAAELGGISGEPRIKEYVKPLNFLQTMFSSTPAQDPVAQVLSALKGSAGPTLQYLYVAP